MLPSRLRLICLRLPHSARSFASSPLVQPSNQGFYEAQPLTISIAFPQVEPGSHIDDEYAKVGLYDPKIVITTSRDPSSRLLQFAKVSRILITAVPSVLANECLRSLGTPTGVSQLEPDQSW
jgi:hypothetical protein